MCSLVWSLSLEEHVSSSWFKVNKVTCGPDRNAIYNLEANVANLSRVIVYPADTQVRNKCLFFELLNLGSLYYTATLQQKLTNTFSKCRCLKSAVSVEDIKGRNKRNSPPRIFRGKFSEGKREKSKKWKHANK